MRISDWSSDVCSSDLLTSSSRRGSWNTMPTSDVGPSTGCPSTVTRPLDGRSSPETMRSRVDLPQPEVPTRETISCSPTERLTPSSARWARLSPASEPASPNTLPTFAIFSIPHLHRLAEPVLTDHTPPRATLHTGTQTH